MDLANQPNGKRNLLKDALSQLPSQSQLKDLTPAGRKEVTNKKRELKKQIQSKRNHGQRPDGKPSSAPAGCSKRF